MVAKIGKKSVSCKNCGKSLGIDLGRGQGEDKGNDQGAGFTYSLRNFRFNINPIRTKRR